MVQRPEIPETAVPCVMFSVWESSEDGQCVLPHCCYPPRHAVWAQGNCLHKFQGTLMFNFDYFFSKVEAKKEKKGVREGVREAGGMEAKLTKGLSC